jgi:sugar lactone lactonase YvrE
MSARFLEDAAMPQARRNRSTLAAIVLVNALTGPIVHAQAPNAQPNPYETIENSFKLPEGRKIGSTAAIHIDRDGTSLWAFERCGAQNCVGSTVAPILKFDASGALVKSFGAGMFIRPHGIHVDRDGNIWVTDGEGPDGKDPARNGKGHQVFKFSPDGKVLMTLGTAGVAGAGPETFNQPSQVLVAPNGDIFVGDGHGGTSNARIVKFANNGRFLKTWGRKGTAPGEFESPHALAMDSRGRLFVADRGNNRLQLFDQEGKFLEEWTQFGRPSGLFIDKDDTVYVADSQSSEQTHPGWTKGIRIGSARDGKVVAFIPDPDPAGSQEGVAADAKGNVYGSLTGGMALRKYIKK